MYRDSLFNDQRIGLVFAHPDDEVIFASSLIQDCSKIILCYSAVKSNPVISKGRRMLKEIYPIENTKFLELTEPNRAPYSEQFNDWRFPVETEFGLKSHQRNLNDDEDNFNKLFLSLKDHLMDLDIVVTHNPWGEYGHPHHILVNRVISKIANIYNFQIYVPGVFLLKSKNLMMATSHRLNSQAEIIKADKDIARELQGLYIQNNCWTWKTSDCSPNINVFYRQTKNDFNPAQSEVKSNYATEHLFQFIDKDYRIHTFTEFILMTRVGFLIEACVKLKKIIFGK